MASFAITDCRLPNRAAPFACESLARTTPSTSMALLRLGVKHNRIITADPGIVGKPPSRMKRGERLLCYKKATCPRCEVPISSWKLGARKIYACMLCQR